MEVKAIRVNTHIRVYWILFLLSCLCCNRSQSTSQYASLRESVNSFVKDSVYTAVLSRSGAGVSYSLLLPSSYDPQKKHPLFLFLDPHADGALPICKYRMLASTFDAVCIGSNNAKNGMSAEQAISFVKSSLADAISRFSIDEHAVFLVGFSGGARLAGTLVAQGFPVAGIIACSAAIPISTSLKHIPVCLVAGLDDANLSEQLDLEEALIQQKQTPVLYCFKGGHHWVSDTVMQQAMRTVLYRHLAADIPDSWCSAYEVDFGHRAQAFADLNDALNLHRLCEERKQLLLKNKRDDNDRFYQLDEANRVSGRLDAERQHWQSILAEEVQRKNKYVQNLNEKDLTFWRLELQKLKSAAQANEDTYHMNQRLLGWLGLVLYSFSSRAVHDGLADADRLVAIYHLLEPMNAEADYLQSILMARKGASAADVTKQLLMAVSHGFSEPDRLASEADFVKYAQDADFQGMLAALKANHAH